MTDQPNDQADSETEDERAADEALHVADPFRWALARMDRGAAARRFAADLARRYTPDSDSAA